MFGGAGTLGEDRIVKPSRWRKQHGRVEAVAEQVQDADGNIGAPYRGVSLLETWERAGKITREMRMAGDEFHRLFHLAALEPLQAADMTRAGGNPGPAKHRGSMYARDAVNDALQYLGGMGSPAGACAWFILGCEYSIRQWAAREDWRGRTMHPTAAHGVFVATLGTLKAYFGY